MAKHVSDAPRLAPTATVHLINFSAFPRVSFSVVFAPLGLAWRGLLGRVAACVQALPASIQRWRIEQIAVGLAQIKASVRDGMAESQPDTPDALDAMRHGMEDG